MEANDIIRKITLLGSCQIKEAAVSWWDDKISIIISRIGLENEKIKGINDGRKEE